MYSITAVLVATSVALLSIGCSSSSSSPDEAENSLIAILDIPATSMLDDASVDSANLTDEIFRLDDVGYRLIELLGGYSLTLTGKQIAAIGELATTTAISNTVLESGGLALVVWGENEPVPFERIQYSCEQGGEMLIKKAFYGQSSASFSHTVEQTEYTFDQCRLSTGGEQTLNGSVLLFDDLVFDTIGNTVDRSVKWTDFSWTKGDDFKLILEASINLSNADLTDSRSSREVNISRYEILASNQLTESVHEGDFLLSVQTLNNGDIQEYSLYANGLVTEQSAVAVQVKTELPMMRKLVSKGLSVEPVAFNGRVTMTAEDRSELILEANSSSVNNTLQVDSTYKDSVGNVINLKAQNFVDLTISAF